MLRSIEVPARLWKRFSEEERGARSVEILPLFCHSEVSEAKRKNLDPPKRHDSSKSPRWLWERSCEEGHGVRSVEILPLRKLASG
jgi:hypothetical protein